MRSVSLICAVFALTANLALAGGSPEETRSSKSAVAKHLQSILAHGRNNRMSILSLASIVGEARRLDSKDPSIDYAFGLVRSKRQQHKQAAESYRVALKIDSTYVAAWTALIRTRLIQKDSKALLADVADLAGEINRPDAGWDDERCQRDAAAFLGRVIAFLARPDTKLVTPDQLGNVEVEIEQRLGDAWLEPYLNGMESFSREYNELETQAREKAAEAAERRQQQATSAMERLQSRSAEARRTTESLQIAKGELDAKFDAELKEIDNKISALNEDKAVVLNSKKKLESMIHQIQLDIARLQTELELQGIRGREARLQPPLVDLQEELGRQEEAYAGLESEVAEIAESEDKLQGERQEIAARRKQGLSQIAGKIESTEKWNKTIDRKSRRVQQAAQDDRVTVAKITAPAIVQQLFPLDFEAESARLLEEHGLEPSTGNRRLEETASKPR